MDMIGAIIGAIIALALGIVSKSTSEKLKRSDSFFKQISLADEGKPYVDRIRDITVDLRNASIHAEQAIRAMSSEINEVTNRLSKASVDADLAIVEISNDLGGRLEQVNALSETLDELNVREAEAKGRIEAMEKIQPEAIKILVDELGKKDRTSAKRDYILFAAGVGLSTVITVILKLGFGI